MRVRPNSSQIWIGDVGWGSWEEVNKIANPDDTIVDNFGWPCYEGSSAQSGYDGANLNVCENLYTSGQALQPYYAYNHSTDVTPGGDACPTGGSSISGLAFYQVGVYPQEYQDALFFSDYSRNCIYLMQKGSNGDPDISTRSAFGVSANGPVHLEIGPGGDLYYAGHSSGSIYRIVYSASNQPPVAIANATPTTGNEPLVVQFDASASTDRSFVTEKNSTIQASMSQSCVKVQVKV